jgi:hypothetical protein
LGVEIKKDGGTKPFRQKFDFDLNCTKKGILNTKSAHYKRYSCYKNHYKRQSGGAEMQVNGDPSASAGIYPP